MDISPSGSAFPDVDKSRNVEIMLEECPSCKNSVLIYFATIGKDICYDHYTVLLCPYCKWNGFRGMKIENVYDGQRTIV